MKMGIMVANSGFFMFRMPSDDTEVTYDYIKSNMIGWLFHSSDIYEYISKLPVEKYLVLCGCGNQCGELIEASLDDIKKLNLTISKKRVLK